MLGYAFVQFSSFFEAKKAIDAVNGTEVKGKIMVNYWLWDQEMGYVLLILQEE